MDYLHVQVDKHDITVYTTYISVDLAHHETFRAKVDKGGIKFDNTEKAFHFCCMKLHEEPFTIWLGL